VIKRKEKSVIRIYTKRGCPDSKRAIELCNTLDVRYEEIVIDLSEPPPELELLGWKGHAPFVVRIEEDPDIPALLETIGRTGPGVALCSLLPVSTGYRQMDKERVRGRAFQVLAGLADLHRDQRTRVLAQVNKLNEI
jgi:hypothetical protein